MSDFNLPAAYAELIAKRPELKVGGGVTLDYFDDDADRSEPYWFLSDDGFEAEIPVNSPIAAALITAKLLEALPRFHGLVNGRYREGKGWYVKDDNENTIYANTRDRYGPKSDTPIQALIAYHLKGASRE